MTGRTLRGRLLASATAAAVFIGALGGAPRPAHALFGIGDIVFDPAVFAQVVNQVQNGVREIEQLTQIYTTARAQLARLQAFYELFAHVTDAAQLAAILNDEFIQSPLLADALQLEAAFRGLGLTTNLAAQIQGIVARIQYYQPGTEDFAARQMSAAARASAGQMASAEDAYKAQAARLKGLGQLQSALATADPKRIADLQARASIETAKAVTTGNQLLAGLMLQGAQRDAAQQQTEQAWRFSADGLRSAAKSATQAAQGGRVVLISTGEQGRFGASASGSDGGVYQVASDPGDAGGYGFSVTPTSADGAWGDPFAAPAGAAPTDPSPGADAAASLLDPGQASRLTGALATQAFGAQAAANFAAVGIDPAAGSAVCTIESNCRNVQGTGTVSGPWQMTDATYNADIKQAIAENPDLASQVVGKNDPATQSIAAAQELKNDARALQAAGIGVPTVLDTRAMYQWGAKYGASLATAPDGALMSDVLNGTPASTFKANGITPGLTTVGDWRNSIRSKLGSAADLPVLSGGRLS